MERNEAAEKQKTAAQKKLDQIGKMLRGLGKKEAGEAAETKPKRVVRS